MEIKTKKYFDSLFKNSNSYLLWNLSFKDEFKETKFQEFYSDFEGQKSKFFFFFEFCCYFFASFDSLQKNDFIPDSKNYITWTVFVIETFLCIFTNYLIKNNKPMKTVMTLKYVRFFIFHCIFIFFTVSLIDGYQIDEQIKQFYRFICGMHIAFFYYVDYNLVVIFLFYFLNNFFILYNQIKFFPPFYFIKELFMLSLVLLIILLFKRNEILSKKDFFSQFNNNELFNSYIQELINVFDSTIISMNENKEVIFVNKLPFFSGISRPENTEILSHTEYSNITVTLVNSFIN
jgi:hypothetical protein